MGLGLKLLAIVGAVTVLVALLYLLDIRLMLIAMAPSVAYEVYRTEGESTRWASWVLMAALILEAALLILNVDLDLARLLGRETETVAGYTVPLGPVTIVGPVVMAVTAIILLVRTRGRFTRWLAAGIIVGAGALIYILDPAILGQWLGVVLDAGLPELR